MLNIPLFSKFADTGHLLLNENRSAGSATEMHELAHAEVDPRPLSDRTIKNELSWQEQCTLRFKCNVAEVVIHTHQDNSEFHCICEFPGD